MSLKEFDSTEPVCRFGPGGDFITTWLPKPIDDPNKWVTLVASTKGLQTRILIVLPFLMTKDELQKVTSDVGEVTREVSTKYLGPPVKDILIDL